MPGVRLEGKVAIVTGAGSRAEGIGNGRAAAVLFAREGARVLLVDQQAEAAERTLAMIRAEGGEAAVFAADVTRTGACRAMVEEAVRRWGRLDVLDNNVGIGGRGTVVDVDEVEWERVMRVNVTGMMLASKHAIARKIAEFLRSTDIVGRVQGGAAFLLLHTTSGDAVRVAERIRGHIENVAFPGTPGGPPRRVTLSVGEVSFPRDGSTDKMLLSRAEANLQEAARQGGNRVVYDESTT